ncbi:hypothetical protein [Natrinema halophilum]|uniref:Uncharacterized protein n=1 Tax=Natrinema halophilum TaxID=1699371 RepID=A0A7D5GIY4_9EURY|nr:hypothetical protein [Natrinema halophilum]QLG47910.1 hypothetical protein HYG82_03140 [Natrinema halophilum]
MSVFEDTYELWYNSLEHDDVPTIEGPPSIVTLQEAADRFEQLGNNRNDGTLVISIEMARAIPRGWIIYQHQISDVEQFDPIDNMVTVVTNIEGREAFICRSDAVRLDMTILEPGGVVAIDFNRGESDD